jgi:hypothetical protein
MVVRNAAVVLFEEAAARPPVADQNVAIYQNTDGAIIGIDGHASFWDNLVEVRWEGSHLPQLERVTQVEIRDQGGHVLESLPVNRTREACEKDGETVFFLTKEE